MLKPSKSAVQPNRSGVAVVELAVSLPVIVFIVLGAIQASHMIQLKHSCYYVVDDMLRLAVQSRANNEELRRYGEQFCQDAGLRDVDFRIRRRPAAATISIEAKVPVDPNFAGVQVFPAVPITATRSAYLENP